MTKVDKLERAVRELSPEDLREFRERFLDYDAELWDKQIEKDVKHGRLDALADEALAQFRQGRTRAL